MKSKRQMKRRRRAVGQQTRLDPVKVWAEIEEQFVPNLRSWLGERLLYFYLIRTVRLAGQREVMTSIAQLAQKLCMCKTSARNALLQLARIGAVRILQRDRHGHCLRVKTPQEIPGCVRVPHRGIAKHLLLQNCVRSRACRLAIYDREKHHCFYCLRYLTHKVRVLDHVVARVRGGDHSYRNVVACCSACNFLKSDTHAEDFLRRLHRRDLISRREFGRRMAALRALKQGKLKPLLADAA